MVKRSTAYKVGRAWGDIRAARKGRIWQRIWNRIIGRIAGRIMGKLWK